MEELFRKSNQYLSFYDVNKLFSWKWRVVVRLMLYSFIVSFALALISIFINDVKDSLSRLTFLGYVIFMIIGSLLLMLVIARRNSELHRVSSVLPNLKDAASSNESVKVKQKILCHVLGVNKSIDLYEISEKYSKILNVWEENKMQFQFGIVDSYMQISKYWSLITLTFFSLFVKTNYEDFVLATKEEIILLSLLGMAFVLVATFAFRGIPYLFGLFGLYRNDDNRSLQRARFFLSEVALASTITEGEHLNH